MALKVSEIKYFMDENISSWKRQESLKALNYYEGRHDIKDYKVFYVDSKGEMVEDDTRSNIKISHPFFTELVDQCSQYMLSGDDYIVKSDTPQLQSELNKYFDDEFRMELNDLITYTKVEGDSFLYRQMGDDFRSHFKFADGLNVVEVPSKYASDEKDHVIYHYYWKTEKSKIISKIQVWDDKEVYFYQMIDSTIKLDKDEPINPRPHIIYDEDNVKYQQTFKGIPFVRLDNNRRRQSDLYIVKDLIDDYDLMACGLSNNLQDVAEGIYVVKGYNGNNLDELTQSIKVKKQLAVGEGGDFDIKTINVPYQARVAKMNEDEKNIYRFGMGLNTNTIGDGNITNYNLKSKYALLEMKCKKLEAQLKRMMKVVIEMVLDEINEQNNTSYTYSDVWVEFKREVMTNAQDNAQIEQIQASTNQIKINTLLGLAQTLDQDTVVKYICQVLDIDYNEIKDKLPQPMSVEDETKKAYSQLDDIMQEPSE